MTVDARSARNSTEAADHGLVPMRDEPTIPAGTFTYEGVDLDTGWHSHDLHQVEYALEGVAEVETRDARYLLPPQQAMWIPTGCEHRTTLRGVRSIAVFFDPAALRGADRRARVLAAPPVLREMMRYATRWPITRRDADPAADAFFAALAAVTVECLDDEVPLALPTATDPVVRAVMDATRADLCATARAIARAVGVSERTLRRRFVADTAMTWTDYVTASRIVVAVGLLVEGDRTVAEVAYAVGFGSTSAFTRAFRAHTGEIPSRYRARRRAA